MSAGKQLSEHLGYILRMIFLKCRLWTCSVRVRVPVPVHVYVMSPHEPLTFLFDGHGDDGP